MPVLSGLAFDYIMRIHCANWYGPTAVHGGGWCMCVRHGSVPLQPGGASASGHKRRRAAVNVEVGPVKPIADHMTSMPLLEGSHRNGSGAAISVKLQSHYDRQRTFTLRDTVPLPHAHTHLSCGSAGAGYKNCWVHKTHHAAVPLLCDRHLCHRQEWRRAPAIERSAAEGDGK
jgi:hypothetical protein